MTTRIDASDALRVTRTMTNQTAALPNVSTGKITSRTPAPVATPRPPLKCRVIGNVCPMIAAIPSTYAPT